MLKFFATLSVFVLCVAASPVLATQGAASADDKELRAYRLTMPAFKQALNVMRRVAEGLQNDPRIARAAKLESEINALEEKAELTEADEQRLEKLQAELEAIEDADDPLSDAKTLSDMAAQLQKEPLYARALAAESMSARDFAKFWLSFVEASFAHGFLKAGTIKELPKDVNLDNVKFIQDNEKEIETLMKEMDALGKKLRG